MKYFCGMAKMTNKQIQFAHEYLVDFNGTQAAVRSGYSVKTAKEQAARLLSNVNIQQLIKELQTKQQKRVGVTADMVINELAKIAFSDISRVFTVDNAIKDISLIDEKDTAAIAAVEVDETVKIDDAGENFVTGATKKVKLWDKLKALDALGKHFGIFEKDNKQKEGAAVTIFQLPDNGRGTPPATP